MAGFLNAAMIPDEGVVPEPSGKLYQIAVMAWFRADGDPMPLSFKFMDDAGEVQTVRDLSIRYIEGKNVSGIPSKEYECEALIGGFIRRFKLVFYCEACKWGMYI